MPAVNYRLLAQKRDELDLSNGELAARVNTTMKYVSNIVSGVDEPSMRVIHRFSRALDLPVEDILAKPTGDPSDPPKQPKNEPTAPPRRQDREGTKGPRRATSVAA